MDNLIKTPMFRFRGRDGGGVVGRGEVQGGAGRSHRPRRGQLHPDLAADRTNPGRAADLRHRRDGAHQAAPSPADGLHPVDAAYLRRQLSSAASLSSL